MLKTNLKNLSAIYLIDGGTHRINKRVEITKHTGGVDINGFFFDTEPCLKLVYKPMGVVAVFPMKNIVSVEYEQA